jgi:hypothetical protein
MSEIPLMPLSMPPPPPPPPSFIDTMVDLIKTKVGIVFPDVEAGLFNVLDHRSISIILEK